jgi:hypothetical protein
MQMKRTISNPDVETRLPSQNPTLAKITRPNLRQLRVYLRRLTEASKAEQTSGPEPQEGLTSDLPFLVSNRLLLVALPQLSLAHAWILLDAPQLTSLRPESWSAVWWLPSWVIFSVLIAARQLPSSISWP